MSLFVVTIKLARTNAHDPLNKVMSSCPTSSHCTDSTGAHHSFVAEGASADEIRQWLTSREVHVTRVELIKNILEMK